MFRFTPRKLLFLVVIILVAGSYALVRLARNANAIPSEFTDARMQGAIIAQNIVNLSNESAEDLQKINELDKEKKYTEALTAAVAAIEKSKEIRSEAVALSAELEKMTASLSEIDSPEARQAAIESISSRLALLSRLINYSGYLGDLLEGLQMRFNGGTPEQQISVLVNQVNAEVTAINNFNSQAGQAMDRFDAIISRQ